MSVPGFRNPQRIIRYGDLIKFAGVNFETGRIKVIRENDKLILAKVPGRNCWVSRGESEYTSPELILMRKVKPANESYRYDIVEVLANEEYTRETRKQVYTKIDQLWEGNS